VCGKNLNIVSPVAHTSNISSCQKKNIFTFPVAVNNSIKVGPLIFLLQMFVITENIMKRPVCKLLRNELIPAAHIEKTKSPDDGQELRPKRVGAIISN